MTPYLRLLADGQKLSEAQAEAALRQIMQGEAEPVELAALLMGLRTRGETLDELVGFTKAMRAFAISVDCDDPDAIDLCGTGGDSSGTFNISTAATFVCAGAGVTVAKHGNRSISSRCGSADVLKALGVNIELRKAGVETCLREAGIAFLFAPFFHPAMKHVMPVRRQLGVRTFFNILGPLCNPAGVRRQLIGAFTPDLARTMAHILMRLDAEHVITLHASDGLDEISIATLTQINEYQASSDQKTLASSMIKPEQFGIPRAALTSIQGGTAKDNAAILRNIFAGKKGPHRDIVVLNAAFGLKTSGRFDSIEVCLDAAITSIDSGAAQAKLDALIEVSNNITPEAA